MSIEGGTSYTLTHAQMKKLEQEISKLRQRLKEAESVISFYADSDHWDYYDSVKDGSGCDIPENPSTPWNAVFLTDEDDSETLDGYGIIEGPAHVNGKRAREYQEKYKDKEMSVGDRL